MDQTKEYYAHSNNTLNKNEWQKLKLHLKNVSLQSGGFARKFGHEDMGKIIGLFHDFGKYSSEFQKRLDGGHKVDHATAGAFELCKREYFKPFGEKIMAYCVVGHHSGLPDTGSCVDSSSFLGRMEKKLADYSAYDLELSEDALRLSPKFNLFAETEKMPFSVAFLTRMLFSCLVDADWLDTEHFMSGDHNRGNFLSLDRLLEKLNNHFKNFINPQNDIDKKRHDILQECIKKSNNHKGFYKLTVPTGGGKTLSSMAFALNHAVFNKQDRVIYTIPYTSIIEQNAQVFREIFGDENILEHHSNYVFNEGEQDETSEKLKLASENWDIPIVVTTNVQFFESLFANKPSRCRKLHNITNSVIILDEAQMLPIEYLKPCLRVLEELVKHYNCTIVLCTATQPALDKYMDVNPTEIISATKELEKFFKRVEVENIGSLSDDKLAERMLEQSQILTIVNTKKHAKELYYKLKNEEGSYHLSTLMCARHRKEKIKEIKARLTEHPELSTRVISTQLIEAGVDIDFPCVYRCAAGLDSVVQSAGRCNRNGKLEMGIVKVFKTEEDYGKHIGFLQRTAVIGKDIIEKYKDPICNEAIQEYFSVLYKIEDTDKEKILNSFTMQNDGKENFEYKTVAEKFRFIEEATKTVIIPYGDEAKELIAKLKVGIFPKRILKKLQPYTINLYNSHYIALKDKGFLENINGFADILRDAEKYNEHEGLIINTESEALFT